MTLTSPQRKPAPTAAALSQRSHLHQDAASFTGWQDAAQHSPAVERLQALQRKADRSFGKPLTAAAPIQRKVVINGKVYGSRRDIAMSTDGDAFGAFQAVTDSDKTDKLTSDTLYEIKGGALVEPEGEVAAEEPALRESPEDRRAREEEAAREQTEQEKRDWGARIDDLKVKITARSYVTHGRSFAHLATRGGGDGLTRFASRDDVLAYLATKVDDFTCQGAQEYNRRAAGIFRATIESQHMDDSGKRGSVILLLLPDKRVVLHHFGNI
ncbi:hypothetical protein [uncultured Roseobacter sp.]|uniref:hypothetical protein n=1 Tax=uncultured Roseobacter sp. TaxID=114847 RepID=UPI00260AEA5D|nr:hypothetical protein [uncultured Roseobacter sp.]